MCSESQESYIFWPVYICKQLSLPGFWKPVQIYYLSYKIKKLGFNVCVSVCVNLFLDDKT